MTEKSLIKKKLNLIDKGADKLNKIQLAKVCNDLAELYKYEGKYELAINEYKNEARVYKEIEKHMEYAQVNRMIGEIYTTLAEFDKALEYEQIHLDIAKKLKNELEQQRAFATIGRIYLTKAITKNSDVEILNLAKDTFLKSLHLCDSLKHLNKVELMDMKARLFLNIGIVKEHQENFEEAVNYMQKSIDICKHWQIQNQLHHGYNTLGLLYSKKDDNSSHKSALTYFNCALEVASGLTDKMSALYSTYSAKSEVLAKSGEYESAKYTLQKAYKLNNPNIEEREAIERNLKIVAKMCQTEKKLLLTPENDYTKRKELYECMGDGAVYLNVFNKAIDYYQKMLQCAIAAGDSGKELLSIYNSLAQTYKDNKQYKLAVEYFQKEFEVSRGNPEEDFKTLLNIAVTMELCKTFSYEQIIEMYNTARKTARKTGKSQNEGKVLSHFLYYQRKMKKDEEVIILEAELDKLNYTESDSETDYEVLPDFGNDINIEDLTDDSDDVTNGEQRKRRKTVKKFKTNIKGETALHTACIKGDLAAAVILVEQKDLINTRDYTGWLPIHEACNYGHLEIVKLLVKKGTSINDRGGIHCEGFTPLHDACANGHLKIIQFLLDHGASALALSDANNSPLDMLKLWYEGEVLDEESEILYNELVFRMATILEKAGRSANTNVIKDGALQVEDLKDSSRNFQKSPKSKIKNEKSPKTKNTTSPKNKHEKSCSYSVGNLRYSIDTLDDLDKPSTSGILCCKQSRSSSQKRILSSSDSSSSSETEQPAYYEYKQAIEGLKFRTKEHKSKKSQKKKKKSAYLCNDEVGDDWLEDDLRVNKKKPYKRQLKLNNFVYIDDGTVSDLESKIGSEKPNETFNLINNTPIEETRNASTSIVISENINIVRTLLSIKVHLENKLFRVPVPANEINNLTIGWLAQETAKRYEEQEKSIPTLQLLSEDGAILSNDDPLSMIFVNETTAEEVHSKVISWNLIDLSNRYSKTCEAMKIVVCPAIKKSLEDSQNSLILKLTGLTYKKQQVLPIFLSLNYQNNLMHIDLSDNSIIEGIQEFCTSLSSISQLRSLNLTRTSLRDDCVQKLFASLISLDHFKSLNLSGNNLSSAAIASFAEELEKVDSIELNELDLSYNILDDETVCHLAKITQKINFVFLNLCGNHLSPKIFDCEMELNLNYLEHFDISYNELNSKNIIKLISFLNFNVISNLNLSHNENVYEFGIMKQIAECLKTSNSNKILTLMLARCCVIDSEVSDLFRAIPETRNLDSLDLSYNSGLTADTLGLILHQRPMFKSVTLRACKNIISKFNIDDYNLESISKITNLKNLKLSVDYLVSSTEIAYLCRIWEMRWGIKAKVNKTYDCYLCLSTRD